MQSNMKSTISFYELFSRGFAGASPALLCPHKLLEDFRILIRFGHFGRFGRFGVGLQVCAGSFGGLFGCSLFSSLLSCLSLFGYSLFSFQLSCLFCFCGLHIIHHKRQINHQQRGILQNINILGNFLKRRQANYCPILYKFAVSFHLSHQLHL